MKKLAIAGASAVLAALPVAGVFATDAEYTSIADKIQLTVNKTCKMEADADLTAQITDPSTIKGTLVNLGASAAPKAYDALSGTPMKITCNAIAGWHLTASATALSSTTTASTIPFGDYQTSTSVWSAAVALSGNNTSNAAIVSGWGTSAWTPSTAGTTVVNDVEDANSKAKPVSGLVITPSYKAYVQSDQAEATYSGTITYTFVDDTPSGN